MPWSIGGLEDVETCWNQMAVFTQAFFCGARGLSKKYPGLDFQFALAVLVLFFMAGQPYPPQKYGCRVGWLAIEKIRKSSDFGAPFCRCFLGAQLVLDLWDECPFVWICLNKQAKE